MESSIDNSCQHHTSAINLAQQGFINDPGLLKTSVCNSSITWLDGEKGELRYRGYAIDQLANTKSFHEVMYLLINGELPDSTQLNEFQAQLQDSFHLPENFLKQLDLIPAGSHPMATVMALLNNVMCHNDVADVNSTDAAKVSASMHMLAIMPSLAIAAQKKATAAPFTVEPETAISIHKLTEALVGSKLDPDHVFVTAIDKILTLHADHELNASTFTMRVVGSTNSNPYACLQAAIAALWGPAHGGANEACLKMLEEIGDKSNIDHYMAKAKDKNDSFKLMGFGHRVYKNYDPRAKIMQKICQDVLKESKCDSPLFELAQALEDRALNDPYCIERKLYPNVDFYSGITLSALGIPSSMFTVIFALARTSGWLSHWLEMHQRAPFKIFRPRQFYDGIKERT